MMDEIRKVITEMEHNKDKAFGPGTIDANTLTTVTLVSTKYGDPWKARKEEFTRIPEGTTMYPVKAKWTTTRHFGDGDRDETFYYSFDFYVNEYHEWDTVSNGPVK